MTHITDTRAQKVVSYTSAHITETVFAHDQPWDEQNTFTALLVKNAFCSFPSS